MKLRQPHATAPLNDRLPFCVPGVIVGSPTSTLFYGSYFTEQAVGCQLERLVSLRKWALVTNGRFRFVGSSTIAVSTSQLSPFASLVRSKYSVSTALSL